MNIAGDIMQEIKKIFIYNKGIWVILSAVILWMGYLTMKPYTKPSKEYLYYLGNVSGKLNAHKESFLEEEAVQFANLHVEKESLMDSFFAGEVAENEYLMLMDGYEEKLKREKGFEQIYEQYLYICENRENRYFMEYNGWEELFSDKAFLVFSSIVILLVVGRFLCCNYETNMDEICKTCKENRWWLVKKVIIANIIAGFMGVFLVSSEYLFISFSIGLEQGNFPIQSVPCLSDSTRELTCYEAFLLMSILRILGCMLYADLILLVSSLVRKMSLTICIAVAMQVLPLFGFTGSFMYQILLPVSFMDSLGYLEGSKYEKDMVTGTDVLIFKEIPALYIKILVVFTLFIIFLAVIWMIKREKNKWENQVIFHRKKKKQALLNILLIIFVMSVAGCNSAEVVKNNELLFNTRDSLCYENGTVKIYFEDTGGFPIVEDKQTGETKELLSDPLLPLKEDCEIMTELFYTEEYVYYVYLDSKEYYHKVGNNESLIEMVSVHEVCLKDYSDKIIFEQQVGTNRQFLGLSYEITDQWSFLKLHRYFCLDDKYLFFITDNFIYQVDRSTKEITKLDISSSGNTAFYQGGIYYINQNSVVERYDITTGSVQQVIKYAVKDFAIYENKLYFFNRQDKNNIWKYDFDTSAAERETETRYYNKLSK